MTIDRIEQKFSGAVPPDRLVVDSETLDKYGRDTTECEPGRPDIVIFIETAKEAEDVVRIAAAERIPIIPRIAGTNLGGLSLAPRGGAILDLTRMNRIIDIDEADMLAVIEPGVTFGQIVRALKDRDLPLTIGIPLSPPHTSVMANCLLDGLGNLSMVYGTMGQWVTGLEVILSTGQVVRTGSWAVSDVPYSRSPLPDLTGMFISWQGTTGLVTKMAVELKPAMPWRRRMFILTYDRSSTYTLMRQLARMRLFDDIGGLSWPTGKMVYGIEKPLVKDPDEPEFYTYIDISGNTGKELDFKIEALLDAIAALTDAGAEIEDPLDMDTLVTIAPKFKKFAEFPTDLEFLTQTEGGGLTWVGTYGPMSRFDTAADLGIKIMERFEFPPLIVSRPMKGGHFGVLRFIETFNINSDREIEQVRRCNLELTDMVLDQGFIPYKTPLRSVERILPRMWPGTHDLMCRLRQVMDPYRIMNPGRWELDPEEES
jgi:FAD/FMN-containing dehydrogenase